MPLKFNDKLIAIDLPTYNVTVLPSSNGSVTATPSSGVPGTIVSLIDTPDSGYVLREYQLTGSSLIDSDKFMIKKSDVSVQPYFKPDIDVWDLTTFNDTSWQDTLVTDGSNNGVVTISKASQFINFGNTVTTFYSSNSLSSLRADITKHFIFNDTSSLTTVQDVYSTLSGSGVKANTSNYGLIIGMPSNMQLTINGNGHILTGLYCYTTDNANAGSFMRADGSSSNTTLKDFTFDRCLFRSNSQASAGFCMLNNGATVTTSFLNFNKCAISSESTASYQSLAFGFLNTSNSSTYNHVQTSFYCCGFRGAKSWSSYSCGDGGISDWSSTPTFVSNWTDSTYISPVKLGGNGTMSLLAGYRANLTQYGTNTYYNLGTGITGQGTSVNSVDDALSTFNNTTLALSRPEFALVLRDDNLYHAIEV